MEASAFHALEYERVIGRLTVKMRENRLAFGRGQTREVRVEQGTKLLLCEPGNVGHQNAVYSGRLDLVVAGGGFGVFLVSVWCL